MRPLNRKPLNKYKSSKKYDKTSKRSKAINSKGGYGFRGGIRF